MPKRKDEVTFSEKINIRLTPDIRERCEKARIAGAHKRDSESTFMAFLIALGIAKYEKALLPLEIGEDEMVSAPKKRKTS